MKSLALEVVKHHITFEDKYHDRERPETSNKDLVLDERNEFVEVPTRLSNRSHASDDCEQQGIEVVSEGNSGEALNIARHQLRRMRESRGHFHFGKVNFSNSEVLFRPDSSVYIH